MGNWLREGRLVVLGLLAAYGIILTMSCLTWRTPTLLGVRLEPLGPGSWQVVGVGPGPAWEAGVRVRDRLTRVSGDDVAGAPPRYWHEAKDLKIEKAGVGEPTDITPSGPTGATPALMYSSSVASLVFLLTGLLVYLKATMRATASSFLGLSYFAGLALVLGPATSRALWWAASAETLALLFTVFFMVLFFTWFPRQPPIASRGVVGMLGGLLAVGLLVAALHIFALARHMELYNVTRRLAYAYLATGLGASLGLLLHSYKTASTPVKREQLRIIVLGCCLAVVPFTLLSLVPFLLGLGFVVRPEAVVLTSVLLPLAFAYAVMRYQLMGVRRLVHRSLVYATLTAGILLLYSATVRLIQSIVGGRFLESVVSQVVLFSVVFIGVAAFPRLRKAVHHLVDRVLYRDHYDYRQTVHEIVTASALAKDLREVGSLAVWRLRQDLNLSFAALVVQEGDDFKVVAHSGRVEASATDLVVPPERRREHCDAIPQGQLRVAGVDEPIWAVALPSSGGRVGTLFLGAKESGEPFRREERDLVATVAGQMATAIEKLQFLAELQRKVKALSQATDLLEQQRYELRQLNRRLVRAHEEERSRVVMFLHDEPLQKLATLAQLSSVRGHQSKVRELARDVMDDLRSFTARLFPPILEDLGLVPALEWLTAESSRKASFAVHLATSGLPGGQRFTKDVELALYHVAQEALANCQKHSGAANVWIKLSGDAESAILLVEDDGVGMRPEQISQPSGAPKLGILAMRERVDQLGGRFSIRARQPSGTRVEAAVPLAGVAHERREG